MTERAEEIARRLRAIDEIGKVVSVLRAIASGRASSAKAALSAILAYEDQVVHALDAIAAPGAPLTSPGPGVLVVIGCAQGFCGGYPARISQAAQKETGGGAAVLVIGRRTETMLADIGAAIAWSDDLSASPEQIPALASRLTDAVLEQTESSPGPVHAISGRDLPGQPVEVRRFWPPTPGALRHAGASGSAPVLTLPRAALIKEIFAELLFARMARALMEGVRAESLARVEAMARATANLKVKHAEVEQEYRQARQEQMTTELLELCQGDASGP